MLKVVFQFKNQGKAGFIRHAKTKTHKHTPDGINNRLTGSKVLQSGLLLMTRTIRISPVKKSLKMVVVVLAGGAGGVGEETVVPLEVAVAIGDKMLTMVWRWVEQLLEIGW